jgi:hypothetical protein
VIGHKHVLFLRIRGLGLWLCYLETGADTRKEKPYITPKMQETEDKIAASYRSKKGTHDHQREDQDHDQHKPENRPNQV